VDETGTSRGGETAVLETERRGAAQWLWLNRPEVLNALSPALLDELDRGLEAAAGDDGVRCVVIAARGRAFCAGADLQHVSGLLAGRNGSEPAPGLRGDQQELLHRVARTFNAIEQFPKPVLGAVQGIAVAGGLELALCCDIVVATESASFGDGHGNFGLVPGGGGSIRLPRRVGHSMAKRLLFTGDRLPARDFLGTDLVSEVTADDALVESVDALAQRIADRSPLVQRLTKRLVNDGVQVPLDVALRMEMHECELHEQSADIQEGVSAFVEKRTPRFVGR